MMRTIVLFVSIFLATLSVASADDLRAPLEKQFFDFFAKQCVDALRTQATQTGKKLENAGLSSQIDSYCACTSQAVVSHLGAEEIISFAVNPEDEPAAGKMKPHFANCQGKGGNNSL